MHPLASLNRSNIILKAKAFNYDLIIIGGGITGAGIALDAASRGLNVLLLEKQDFSAGTSSRSTKLIHGGLRYLKQFDFGLVHEVGKERAVLHHNAPHLVIPEKMLLPIIKGGSYGKYLTAVGLWLYDFLADVKSDEKKKMISKSQLANIEPLLRKDITLGAGFYTEYRTDDARLTIGVIKTAATFGADCLNYMMVDSFLYSGKKLIGVNCIDQETKEYYVFNGKQIVNAAGPWVDQFRIKDKSLMKKQLHLTKGVHLVVPSALFPVKQAVYFDAQDGRMIFAIPISDKTYFGTTDTDYSGDLENPMVTVNDVNYLIKAVSFMFPEIKLEIKDVESSWAGLRPLIHEKGKSPSELSRKDEIFESESGLISIAGGKLTGYRKMAERITNKVVDRLNKLDSRKIHPCQTIHLKINGAEGLDPQGIEKQIQKVSFDLEPLGLGIKEANYLVNHYGNQVDEILTAWDIFPSPNPIIQLARAELYYCLNREAVMHLDDFIIRRSSRLYFDLPSISVMLPILLKDFGDFFNLESDKLEYEKHKVEKAVFNATNFKNTEES